MNTALVIFAIAAIATSDSPIVRFAQLGIFAELGNPKDLVIKTFDESRIQSVRQGALVTCILIITAILIKIVLDYRGCSRFAARREIAAEQPLLMTE